MSKKIQKEADQNSNFNKGSGKAAQPTSGQGNSQESGNTGNLDSNPIFQRLQKDVQSVQGHMLVQTANIKVFVVKDGEHFIIMTPPFQTNQKFSNAEQAPTEIFNLINGMDYKVMVKENKKILENAKNLVKKDLLRRKIQEHFNKFPKAKSVIITANIDENKTIWKVDKIKSGFSIVEVTTQKEQYIIEAAGQNSPAFQQVVSIVTPLMGNLGTTQQQAAQARNQVNALMPKITDPREKTQAGGLLNYLGALTGGAMAATPPTTPISQAPGGMPVPSGKSGLTSGRFVKGKRIKEADEKKKQDDEEDIEDQEAPENASETEPEMELTPDQVDAGLETGDVPAEQPQEDPETAPEDQPKTGEEVQLKQLVKTKPIQNIHAFVDEDGSHLVMSLGGLKNPVQFDFTPEGKITYKLGDLSRVLKSGK